MSSWPVGFVEGTKVIEGTTDGKGEVVGRADGALVGLSVGQGPQNPKFPASSSSMFPTGTQAFSLSKKPGTLKQNATLPPNTLHSMIGSQLSRAPEGAAEGKTSEALLLGALEGAVSEGSLVGLGTALSLGHRPQNPPSARSFCTKVCGTHNSDRVPSVSRQKKMSPLKVQISTVSHPFRAPVGVCDG